MSSASFSKFSKIKFVSKRKQRRKKNFAMRLRDYDYEIKNI